MRRVKDRSAVPHSGDRGVSPSPPNRRTLSRLDGGTLLVVLAAVVVALLPLALASWAFGRSYRASELGRTDARLLAGGRVAADRLRSGADEAERAATALAHERALQVALVHGENTDLSSLGRVRGDIRLTVTLGPSARLPAGTITRTVAVGNAGRVVGHVSGIVRVQRVLREVGRQTGVLTLPLARGRIRGGPLAGTLLPGPAAAPYDANLARERYRALREPLAPGFAVALLVPYRTIDSTVSHRQLLTFAAGAVTLVALALVALLLLPRGRRLLRPLRGRGGRRSTLALVGDVAVAAHDPQALLPVILETAVLATGATGGYVIWNGSEIAMLGIRGDARRALVFRLGEAGDPSDGKLVLHPGRRGFSAHDREVVESLVSQGRIALENARLQLIVRRQAHTDELTDLANRRGFMEALQQEVARSSRFGSLLSLVIFDLDRFKRINDRCGHQAGDAVLRETAEVIRNRVRETDLPARIGGEEFALILAGTDLAGAAALAENLRRDIEQQVQVPGTAWCATASFGVAEHHAGEAVDALLGAADRALYRAKEAGRNTIRAADGQDSRHTPLAG